MIVGCRGGDWDGGERVEGVWGKEALRSRWRGGHDRDLFCRGQESRSSLGDNNDVSGFPIPSIRIRYKSLDRAG